MRVVLGAALAALMSVSAAAQPSPNARIRLLPYIRALSDCVARVALIDPGLAPAIKRGERDQYIRGLVSRCPYESRELVSEHDAIHGYGSGMAFLEGAYIDDLPRAVMQRIAPRVAEKVRAYELEEQRRQAEQQRLAVEQQRMATERARLEAEQRADQERIAAVNRAAAQRREEERLQRIDVAKRATSVVKDRFYECVEGQLQSLVSSNESADVLTTASMTICGAQFDSVLRAAMEEYEVTKGVQMTSADEGVLRAQLKSAAREAVLAKAVQVKAAAHR